MSMSLRRAVGATAAIGLAVVGLQLTGIGSALAHDATVSGSASCASNGTYTVTWTITNRKTDEEESATIKNLTPSGSTIDSVQVNVAKNGSSSVVQRNIPGNATTAGITVDAIWTPDNYKELDIQSSVSLGGVCKTLRTAATPSAKNGACVDYTVTKPAVVIPKQTGIDWTLDGKSVASGTRTVFAGAHKVTASSTVYTLTGKTSWTYNLTSAAGNCSPPPSATPVTPEIRQASCTGSGPSAPRLYVPDTKGIEYEVSAKAPYSPGQDVKVIATVKKGYQLGDLTSGWKKSGSSRATRTVRFAEAPACSGVDDVSDTNSPANGIAAGGASNGTANGGLAATGTRDFGPLAAIALAMLATGLVIVRRTRRA